MNLLLDTHVFLWSLFSPEKLSSKVIQTVKSPDNDVAVSVVSFWEISLKFSLGKLELTGVSPEKLPDFADQMSLETLPLTAVEASSFYNLPRSLHKDPFDRIIIWQAIQRKLILASKDENFQAYRKFGLRTIW